jgi:hypothetical protein
MANRAYSLQTMLRESTSPCTHPPHLRPRIFPREPPAVSTPRMNLYMGSPLHLDNPRISQQVGIKAPHLRIKEGLRMIRHHLERLPLQLDILLNAQRRSTVSPRTCTPHLPLPIIPRIPPAVSTLTVNLSTGSPLHLPLIVGIRARQLRSKDRLGMMCMNLHRLRCLPPT